MEKWLKITKTMMKKMKKCSKSVQRRCWLKKLLSKVASRGRFLKFSIIYFIQFFNFSIISIFQSFLIIQSFNFQSFNFSSIQFNINKYNIFNHFYFSIISIFQLFQLSNHSIIQFFKYSIIFNYSRKAAELLLQVFNCWKQKCFKLWSVNPDRQRKSQYLKYFLLQGTSVQFQICQNLIYILW